MQDKQYPQNEGSSKESTSSVVRDLFQSTKDLAKSEIELVKGELKESTRRLGKHSAQAAAFGALLAISVIPFIGFLVIGLGDILNGRYWLSSLIVSIFCALVGGAMAMRAFEKIKNYDLDFHRSKQGLSREMYSVQEKLNDIKDINKRRNV